MLLPSSVMIIPVLVVNTQRANHKIKANKLNYISSGLLQQADPKEFQTNKKCIAGTHNKHVQYVHIDSIYTQKNNKE